MKNFITILAVCLTGIVLVGCGDKKEDYIYTEETASTIETTSTTEITSTTETTSTTVEATTSAIETSTSTETKVSIIETTIPVVTTNSIATSESQREVVVPAQDSFKESEEPEETTITQSTTTTTETALDSFPKTGLIEIELIPVSETAPTEEHRETIGDPIGIEKIGRFKIVGYSGDTMTASGKVPKTNHTIAMNDAQRKELGLLYGQEIYISGDTVEGIYTLEDCGCGWGVINVFCSSESECYRITSYADVYIVVN